MWTNNQNKQNGALIRGLERFIYKPHILKPVTNES